MSKHVQTCPDMSKHIFCGMNCYDSYDFQTCLNLFRINMIRIDTIIKYVKTWRNTLKLSKWHEESFCHWRKAIPWIAWSKSSDQKSLFLKNTFEYFFEIPKFGLWIHFQFFSLLWIHIHEPKVFEGLKSVCQKNFHELYFDDDEWFSAATYVQSLYLFE